MADITILKRDGYDITLNKNDSKFNVNLIADVEYNEPGFQEFLEYFKNTWLYIKEQNDTYYLIY